MSTTAEVLAPAPSAPADGTPLVSVTGLHKTFTRGGGALVPAVDGIDLDIRRGEIVALVGPSGCGKTTLLRCIAGLETPTSGSITINGRRMYDAEDRTFVPPERRGISMMFQSYAIWPHMSVARNVGYPLQTARMKKRAIEDRVRDVLATVGISELYDQMPNSLSGGQQQRVALARCLVSEPSVMLFDEPLSNVDAQVRASLRLEILEMHRRLGFAALYVTHDQDEAMQVGQRLAVLELGRFAQSGSPQEVYQRPETKYVADFVGQINEWTGILNVTDQSTTLVTDNSTIMIDLENIANGCVAGSTVTGIVRPELITIAESRVGDIAPNHFRGTVLAAMFRGAHTEYLVELGDHTIIVWYSGRNGFTEGQEVEIGFTPSDVRIVGA